MAVISLGGVLAYYAKDLPSPASLQELKIAESTKIYDHTGKVLLYDIHGEYKRTIIPFEEIPDYIKLATIATEDDDFYNHFGIDFKGVARAALANIKGKTVRQGGSTITQQLIKNMFLTPERTLSRKIKELILTLEMEIKYSKDEILNFYLNAVPYGSNAYGVDAASQTFFNKNPRDLTLAESALLASLPKAPTYYSPFGSNTDELKKRQEYILNRMHSLGYISEDELNQEKSAELNYNYDLGTIKAPHFVMYVREQLERDFGDSQLKDAGLVVNTALDWDLQQEAERIVKEFAEKNKKRFGAKNAALVAIDPSSGKILAMVGSRDYFNKEIDGNVNVTIRPRQPGSSFKPFAYAKAFEKGYTPDTMIVDAETNFGVQGAKEYIPKNYDEKFRGPLTFREALAQSINVPAVKVLYLAGLSETINLARSMGIESLNKDASHYGLSLVLGGGEIKLLEETAAYGVFAQDGTYYNPTAILAITSHNGEHLYEFTPNPKKVLDAQITRLITDILSDNEARAPVFGLNSPLNLKDIPAAAKSGTTQNYRDAWTVGYTPKIAVGVWVGNNDNSEMDKGAGVKAAAPIWNEFISKAYKLKGWGAQEFTKPEPIETSKPILNGSLASAITMPIDVISGKIATEYTPKELVEEKTFYDLHSLLYYVQKDNPRGEPPHNPEDDPQFTLWEEGVKKWMKTQATSTSSWQPPNSPSDFTEQATSSVKYVLPPTEYDDVHIPDNFPKISVIYPPQNHVITEATLRLNISLTSTFPIQKIVVSFDDLAETTITNISLLNRDYSILLSLPDFFLEKKGPHIITIRAYDTILNKSAERVAIISN